jgi:hypothetical protein
VYVADQFDEAYAGQLLAGQLTWIEAEAAFCSKGLDEAHHGSFYGRRIAALIEQSPYYYTRLESDRACALGMALAYLNQRDGQLSAEVSGAENRTYTGSAAGGWVEPEHGAVLDRGAHRLTSFAWRAHGLAQGMCTPPDDGHLSEWSYNLAGLVRFLGDDGVIAGGQTRHRKLLRHTVDTFDGGFATCGTVIEGVDLILAEGWRGDRSAAHQLAFVALPDGHAAVGLQHCRTDNHRTYLVEAKGLHLNLPNDLFNEFERRLETSKGEVILHSPVEREQVLELGSRWAHIDGRVGVAGLYGGEQLVVHRSPRRRGGRYASLYVDEICLGCALGMRAVQPNTVVLDVGWGVLSGASLDQIRLFAEALGSVNLRDPSLRAVRVRGLDGCLYVVLVNFGDSSRDCPSRALFERASEARDLVAGKVSRRGPLSIGPGAVRVFALA